ncbi:MAG: methylmalonic aciduria and homocystinuria type D protein [Calothrix sp. MO_192.B10]|nr:methylmalonic aciduria and homocystinuria type D protein [Calothrix sp. MO_192.B10]
MNYPTVSPSEQSHPINLVGKMGKAIQITIHSPSEYIQANRDRILPDWKDQPSLWLVIVLQQSQYQMLEITPKVEREKQQLRENFMRFGFDVAFHLRDRGYLSDLIDPRTGYPLLSHPGEIPHDDTAAVNALLHYPIIRNKCRLLIHPQWGISIYPSILISTAHPTIIELVIKNIAPAHGWKLG